MNRPLITVDPVRLAKFEQAHLRHGAHKAPPNGGAEACVEEWSAFLAGEPHSDQPQCVCPVIAAMRRSMNDNWPDTERDRLKPSVLPSLGSRSTPEVEAKRAVAALDWTMRVHRPIWLRAAGLDAFADRMAGLPEIVDEAMLIRLTPKSER